MPLPWQPAGDGCASAVPVSAMNIARMSAARPFIGRPYVRRGARATLRGCRFAHELLHEVGGHVTRPETLVGEHPLVERDRRLHPAALDLELPEGAQHPVDRGLTVRAPDD